MVGLLAAPAAACFDSSAYAPNLARVASYQGADSSGVTPAEYRAALEGKLAKITARLTADQAQWNGVASSAVLAGEQRKDALADLGKAAAMSAVLVKVPTAGTYSASSEQQAQITQLRAALDAFAAQLRSVLTNRPDLVAVLQDKLQRIEARTATDKAQWAGTAAGTVLGADARRAARADLRAAKSAADFLDRVEDASFPTAAQRTAIDAIQADLAPLIPTLKPLLANGERQRDEAKAARGVQQVNYTRDDDRSHADRPDRSHRDRDRDGDRDRDRKGRDTDGHDGHRERR
jgi:hypothetical protein